ncbi:MAG: hypothetical protein IPP96_02125 [Chitinophagaceae bacterium]|nr:hypothetical protein [Chitinophagaceae bacterium]
MNNRNKLATLWLLLFFILTQHVSVAQSSFDYSGGNFNLTLAPINPTQAQPKAYYTLFIETGSGRYSKSGQINDGKNILPYIYAFPYQINNNSQALATVSSYYDTTPRPPRHTAIAASNPNGPMPPDQNVLQGLTGKFTSRIGIDPCVNVIVPGDTMSAALVYKPYISAGTNTLVAFFYNKPTEGGNIFSPINAQTRYSFNSPQQTKAIRTHNNETIYTSLPDGLPADVAAKLNTAHSGYTDAIYFIVNSATDEKERNIFFSLAPTRNTFSYNNSTSTSFGATILQYNAAGTIEQQNFYSPLGINMIARDPNGIKTSPHCLNNPGDDVLYPYDITIGNNVNFQNDGAGDAKDVEITVTVPEGIKFPTLLSNASVRINGTTRWFTPCPGTNCYTLNAAQRQIVFKMKNVFLKGTVNEKDPVKRSGRISFFAENQSISRSHPRLYVHLCFHCVY